MKRQYKFILLLVAYMTCVGHVILAQKVVEPQYASNIVPALVDSMKKKQVVCEFRNEVINFIVEDNNAFKETLSHERYYLNTSESIESFKEMKFSSSSDMLNLIKVRVIIKDGSIVNTDNKFVTNYKDENSHDVKASVQGLEVGCSIEFINLKRDTDLDFFRVNITTSVPTLNYSFRFAYLKRLNYVSKIYNCNYKLKVEEGSDSTVCSLTAANIKEAKVEDNQIYRDLQAHLVFQFESQANSKMNLSWQSIANEFVRYIEPKEKETKYIDKIVRKLIGEETSIELKARLLEDYIKKTVYIRSGAPSSSVVQAIDNRYCNANDLIRVYSLMFTCAGIKVQYVFTRTRYQGRFDADFPSPYTCTFTLVYLPELDMYIIPEYAKIRLGIITEDFSDQLGVFVSSVRVGDIITAIVRLKSIPIQDVKFNNYDFNANVELDPNTLKTTATYRSVASGFTSFLKRNLFGEVNEEKEIKSKLENFINDDKVKIKVKSVKITNKNYSPTEPNLPFIEDCVVFSDVMAERTGNDILVHLGWIIGKQQMLSKVETRTTPLFKYSPTLGYTRKVTLKAPEGYTVKGLEKLDKDISYLDGKLVFKTKFSHTDTELVFENTELYNIIDIPAADYYKYEEVVNAAAYLYNQDILLVKK